jgi:hypothetical protein
MLTLNKDTKPTSSIEKSKYLNGMDEVFETICSLISPNLLFHISSCKTPHPKKEGYTKPFNDSSGSRNEKGKKGNRCTYCQRGFHPESSCMKKQIDQMAEILQKHNLGDHIPQGAKKKTEDPPHGKGNNFHALVAINSSPRCSEHI